ncbi:enoyl-CoA hydratase-related protein [Thioclava sp. GXIMD2076]|uniref:enoyl-CoA hydratase-related protein n=1 Tax=Thioclava sp. GXIMD2076 TaxID=3131931 RepID=UPI0030D47DAA
MVRRIRVQRCEGVTFLTLPDAGARGFDAQLRRSLGAALDMCRHDPDLRGVVMRAAAGWPCAEDPEADFHEDAEAPSLAALAQSLSDLSCPVAVVLDGRIRAGALALAQAAKLRLALDTASFDPVEPSLGYLPAAGCLIRYLRRSGPRQVLSFLKAGRPVAALQAVELGVCDAVVPAEAVEMQALSATLEQAFGEVGLVPDPNGASRLTQSYFTELDALREAIETGPQHVVWDKALAVAEAAVLLPMGEALDFEAVAHLDLLSSPASKALRHLRASAARAHAQEALPIDAATLGCRIVAVWNPPDGLVYALADAGHRVIWAEAMQDRLEKGLSNLARAQEAAVLLGRMSGEARDAAWDRVSATTDPLQAFAQADIVLAEPAAQERDDIAHALEGVRGALVATTQPDCALRIDRYGRHVEVHGAAVEDTLLVAALLRAGGDLALGLPGVDPGLIARLQAAIWVAAEYCVLAGAAPEEVDQALQGFGMQAPFAQIDRLGVEVVIARLKAAGFLPGPLLTYLMVEGYSGLRKGRGVYLYSDGVARPDPLEPALLEALRAEADYVARPLTGAQIIERIWLAMAAEGAKLLQLGAVDRPGDLDLSAVNALEFPRHEGGPMFMADQRGLEACRDQLMHLAAGGAAEPVTLWDVLIRNGRSFGDLDRA